LTAEPNSRLRTRRLNHLEISLMWRLSSESRLLQFVAGPLGIQLSSLFCCQWHLSQQCSHSTSTACCRAALASPSPSGPRLHMFNSCRSASNSLERASSYLSSSPLATIHSARRRPGVFLLSMACLMNKYIPYVCHCLAEVGSWPRLHPDITVGVVAYIHVGLLSRLT